MTRVLAAPMTYQPQRRRKRWVECAYARHATEGRPAGPGDVVATLCGESVVVVRPLPGMYAPECPDCDRLWRVDEGIPQRNEHRPRRRVP